MGRPRPKPENGIHGLPIVPPQAPRSNGRNINVTADVNHKPADLSYQNHNFRETPSMPSIHPNNEYWDSPTLQTNGHAVHYNKKTNNINNNVPNGFPRTTSTATTFALAPTSTEALTEPGSRTMTPTSLHHPLSVHHHPPSSSSTQYPLSSKSYDPLVEMDRSAGGVEYVPNIFPDHRQSLPPSAFNANNELGVTPSQMSHKDLLGEDRSRQKPKPNLKPRPNLLDSSTETEEGNASPEVMSFTSQPETSPQATMGDDKNQSGSRKARIIETSLDDLEVDYELEETIRPVSTYLETNVDDMPPLRSAKSQYIPSSGPSSSGNHSHHNQHTHHHPSDDFKALSNRSKSMPLETEM